MVLELPQVIDREDEARGFFYEYAVGRLYIDLRLVVRPKVSACHLGAKEEVREYWVAILERVFEERGNSPAVRIVGDERLTKDGDEGGSVLVDPVKLSNLPQRIESVMPRLIAGSVIRLQAYNYVSRLVGNVPCPVLDSPLDSLDSLIEDRELSTWLRGLRGEQGQLPDKMIEGRTEIVNVVPDYEAESNWRIVNDAHSADARPRCANSRLNELSNWQWIMGLDTVRFETKELPHFVIERAKVFLRPVEFEPDLIQRVHEVNLGL